MPCPAGTLCRDMVALIIFGIVDVVALIGLRRAGGFGAAASALQDWGRAVSEPCPSESASRKL
jgi:hypothetical protein